MTNTASAVSRQLRSDGFNPVAPSDRSREGLRVTNTHNAVRVVADLDGANAAKRMAADAAQALVERGYSISWQTAAAFVAARLSI